MQPPRNPGRVWPVRTVLAGLLAGLAVSCTGPLVGVDELPRELRARIAAAPEPQRAVVQDGRVSAADADAAAAAVARCLQASGVTHVSVDVQPPARPGLAREFGWSYAIMEVDEVLAGEERGEYVEDPTGVLFDACYERHFSVIGAVYRYRATDPRVAEQHLQELLGDPPTDR